MEGLACQFLSWWDSKKESTNYNCAKKNPPPGIQKLGPVDRSKEEDKNMVEVIEDSPHSQPLVGKKSNICDSPGKWGLNYSDAGNLGNQGMVCPSEAWIGKDFYTSNERDILACEALSNRSRWEGSRKIEPNYPFLMRYRLHSLR